MTALGHAPARVALAGFAIAASFALSVACQILVPTPASASQAMVFVQPQPSGPPGAMVTVVGVGFDPNDAVEVRWGSIEGRPLAVTQGPDFKAELQVPPATQGLHTLVVLSRNANGALGSSTSTSFFVTAPGVQARADDGLAPTTTAPLPGSAEAATPTPVYLWVAIALGLAGLAALAWRHRAGRSAAANSDANSDANPEL